MIKANEIKISQQRKKPNEMGCRNFIRGEGDSLLPGSSNANYSETVKLLIGKEAFEGMSVSKSNSRFLNSKILIFYQSSASRGQTPTYLTVEEPAEKKP